MSAQVTNNAWGILAAAITAGAGSLTLNTGQGARFPLITGTQYFYSTLSNSSGVLEIVKVTAVASDTFTILRGQDGTTAAAYALGDRLELRPTAALLNEKLNVSDAAAIYAPLVGAQLSGNTFFGTNSTSSSGIFNGPAASFRGAEFETAGVLRWTQGADSTAEGGANAGSNYDFTRYSDAGTLLDIPLSINRATGIVTFADGVVVTTGGIDIDAGGLTVGLGGANITGDSVLNGGAATPTVTIASSATPTVDCTKSNVFLIDPLSVNITALTMSGTTDGQTINLYIVQDATGGRTIAWPPSFKQAGGSFSSQTLSTAPAAVDRLTATWINALSIWDCTLAKGIA